jgi:hypothetical protein
VTRKLTDRRGERPHRRLTTRAHEHCCLAHARRPQACINTSITTGARVGRERTRIGTAPGGCAVPQDRYPDASRREGFGYRLEHIPRGKGVEEK